MSALDKELLDAAGAFDLERVKAAIAGGADVDATAGSTTALMTASMRSAIDIMRVLVEAGASVDLKDDLGNTALIFACMGRGGESIDVLLGGGADPNLGDRREKRPLMWLVDTQFHMGRDTSPSIGPLVDSGAAVNDRDDASRSALHWAVLGLGTSFDVVPRVLTALVDNGADVGAQDVNGETAMFGLVRYIDDSLGLDRGKDCIQILVDAGADRNATNNSGQTPLGVTRPDNPLVHELLESLGFVR